MLPEAKTILQLTSQDLASRIQSIKNVELHPPVTKVFSIAGIAQGIGEHGIRKWLTGENWAFNSQQPAIYVISADSVETANAIASTFDAPLPLGETSYKRPKRNREHNGSQVIYVGSSVTSVRTRLKQHLWQCAVGTYALHLNRWASRIDAPGGTLTVEVMAVQEPGEFRVIQNIEDAVWRELRPILGKLGAR